MGADETDALLSAVQACVEKVRPPALPPSRFNPSRPAVSTPHCDVLVLLAYCRWALCVVGAAQVACSQVAR